MTMKTSRFATGLAAMAVALSASMASWASPPDLDGFTIEKYREINSRFALPAPIPARAMTFQAPVEQYSGKYFVQWDNIGGANPRLGYDALTRISFTADSAFIENFYNLGFTARGKYDAATSTISFSPQAVFEQYPYGVFSLAPFDVDKGGFYSDPKSSFTVKVNDDGTLSGGSLGWVVVVMDPTSAFYGSALGMSREIRFQKTNATMSGNRRNIEGLSFAPYEYPVYVEQQSDDDLLIANIATNGREVHMRLKPDSTWVMEPQIIVDASSLSTTGPSCTFPAEWSVTANKSKGINASLTGKGDDTMLEFGPWGAFRAAALLTCTFGMESSVLVLEEGTIKWPSASSYDLEGEGTEQNPYTIGTVDDLMTLAKRVESGDRLTGKIVRQTADINFSDLKGMYYPIGDKTNYFDGTYDGNGKVIRNMNITRGSNQYTGLFGYVGANGYIHDVNIINGRISTSGKYNGLIAGYSLGRIERVDINGLISSTTEYNGGVAGYSRSVRDSRFIGQLSGMAYTGGISGQLVNDTIANCRVSASITSNIPNTIAHGVGGIAGGVNGSATAGYSHISDCYFLGSMTDVTGYAWQGCISGILSSYSSITRCMAVGVMTTKVTASSIGACGALVGSLSGGGVSDCYASVSMQDPNATPKIGGLVGLGSVSSQFQPEVKNCIYTGQVLIQGITSSAQALHGTLSATSGRYPEFVNTYADGQVSGLNAEDGGLSTAVLTSGEPLEGFDTDIWQFTPGRYPIIKNLVPANVAALATVPFSLSGNEKVTNVKNDITLTLDPNVSWLIYTDGGYTQESDGLKIEGDKVRLKGILSQEFLTVNMQDASLGGTFSRLYYLNVAPVQFEGEGTADSPYLIKTPEDMKKLNTAITQNGLTFEGEHYALANDIDFSGVTDFYGIADDSNELHTFSATFDGRGHSIKNWVMDGLHYNAEGKIANSRQTSALFGILGAAGTVKNVIIDSSCELRGQAGIASTVAICFGKVENVRNYARVISGTTHAAGIVARLCSGASVTNCYNAGNITAGSTYAVGIVAEMQANTSVSNCQNDGVLRIDSLSAAYTKTSDACAAGIAGNTLGATRIVNCVNQGDMFCYNEGGGILGRCAAGTVIENCINTGILNVRATGGTLGGIVATNRATDDFINVYYDGQIIYQGAASCAPYNGCEGLNSSMLVSGQPLNGLSDGIFDYQTGMYPVLKAFKDEKAAVARRSMTFEISQGDVINEISKSVTLGSTSGVKWTLGGTGFQLSGNALVPLSNGKPGNADVTATVNDYTRTISVQSYYSPFQGDGTQQNPYRLNTKEDWNMLSDYTNTYGYRYEGKYFCMDNDVQFDSTRSYVPVAFNSSNHFSGEIDGRGHRLKGVRMEYTDKANTATYQNVAVISMLGRNGAVRNLSYDGRIRSYKYAGGLVAISYGTVDNCHNYAFVGTTNNTNTGGVVCSAEGGTISNCTNRGTVWGSYNIVGGIVSYAASGVVISNCTNYATVQGKDSVQEKYYTSIGGVVGNCFGRMVNCVNYGNVLGSGTVGGIASTVTEIDSCVNYADISCTGSMIGGVASKLSSYGTMSHCYNYGVISGVNYTGGVLGDAGSYSTISFCANRAEVKSNSKPYTGGISGDMAVGTTIDSCANYGNISGTGTNSIYVGGISGGGATKVYINNSVNYGDIIQMGTNCYGGGGIAGICAGEITDCYNYGNVTSQSYGAGGISGYGGGKALRCVNLGNISTVYDLSTKKIGNAGGIWGNGASGVNDCINYGDVTGLRYVGGIQGYAVASTKMSRVYFSGKLTSGDAATTGAIIHIDATQTKVVVDSAYYNVELTVDIESNEKDSSVATAMTPSQMRTAALGDAFDYHEWAMPTLKRFAAVPDLNVAAAMIVFKETENAQSFKTSARVQLFDGAVWSVTPNLKLDGNKICVVSTKVLDPATITVQGPRYSRSFAVITDNGGTSVEGIDAEKTPLSVRYFNIAGVEVQSPTPGTTVIEVIRYTDGTSSTRKKVIR